MLKLVLYYCEFSVYSLKFLFYLQVIENNRYKCNAIREKCLICAEGHD
jgi:hypothetical protein